MKHSYALIAAAVAALTLTACERRDDTTVGQQVDTAPPSYARQMSREWASL